MIVSAYIVHLKIIGVVCLLYSHDFFTRFGEKEEILQPLRRLRKVKTGYEKAGYLYYLDTNVSLPNSVAFNVIAKI